MDWYHGTSTVVLDAIREGRENVIPVFQESNISLGGAYFTTDEKQADFYAREGARKLGGMPIVLLVRPDELFPDEDWVVALMEEYEDEDMTDRLQGFIDDLFIDYQGEGFSLSDHYKDRYRELNRKHGITWRDSVDWIGSARQEAPLRLEQIRSVVGDESSLSRKNPRVYGFHGTEVEFVDGISERGLVPCEDWGEPTLFVANDEDIASQFGEYVLRFPWPEGVDLEPDDEVHGGFYGDFWVPPEEIEIRVIEGLWISWYPLVEWYDENAETIQESIDE